MNYKTYILGVLTFFVLGSTLLLGQTVNIKTFQKISGEDGNMVFPTNIGDDADLFGHSIANIGDLDSNGVNDLAIGVPQDDDYPGSPSSYDQAGAVYILFMNSDGTVKSNTKISNQTTNFGGRLTPGDRLGQSVCSLGDIDGDGITDIAAGAHLYGSGSVWVIRLNSDGTAKAVQHIAASYGGFTGSLSGGAYFGHTVTSGDDYNGDGRNELLVASPKQSTLATRDGAVWVLSLDTNGTVDSILTTYKPNTTKLSGYIGATDEFGSAVCNIGDIDGNGYDDISVSAFGDDDGGTNYSAAYILLLQSSATIKKVQKLSADSGSFSSNAFATVNAFANQVTGIPDFNGDSIPDIIVNSWVDDDAGFNTGIMWFVEMDTTGDVKDHYKLVPDSTGPMRQIDDGDRFGAPQLWGDYNNDGYPDIIAGSPYDDDSGTDRGAIYVMYMDYSSFIPDSLAYYPTNSSTKITLEGSLEEGDQFGGSSSTFDDLDLDGTADILVGAYHDNDGFYQAGALWLLHRNDTNAITTFTKFGNVSGNFKSLLIGGDIDSLVLDSNDFFGHSVSNVGDLNLDGINDFVVGAYGDDDGGENRGAVYTFLMNEDGTVKCIEKISDTRGNLKDTLENNAYFGFSVAGLGDVNGDTIPDVAVGVPGNNAGGSSRGAVYLLYMNTNGRVKDYRVISDTSGNFTASLDNEDQFGYSVSNFYDRDGNGVNDLLVGAPFTDDDSTNSGAIYLILLTDTGTTKSYQKISNTAGGLGSIISSNANFGKSVSIAGDINEDGFNDIVVGAPDEANGGYKKGSLYVLMLDSAGTSVDNYYIINDTIGSFTLQISDNDYFGFSVSYLGDYNNDGYQNILVGSMLDEAGATNTGTLYDITLDTNGTPLSYSEIGVENFTAGLKNGDAFGSSLAVIGDLDVDGIPEIVVGAYLDDDAGVDAGAIYIVYPDIKGNIKSYRKISSETNNIGDTLNAGDNFGVSVCSIGDLNGDGIIDIAVGAYNDDDGGTNRGAIYILLLNSDGSVLEGKKISSTQGNFSATLDNNDLFGSSLAFLGDINNDGFIELAVGAIQDDDGAGNAGAAYLLSLDAEANIYDYTKVSSSDVGGIATFENFGSSLASVGDINNDGINDLAVGAYHDYSSVVFGGAIYILFLNDTIGISDYEKIVSGDGGISLNVSDEFGISVIPFADVDTNGVIDIIVGASKADAAGTDAGSFWVVKLDTTGAAIGSIFFHPNNDTLLKESGGLSGINPGDQFGKAMANLGDFNQDDQPDIVVSAYGADEGGTNRGAIYILPLSFNNSQIFGIDTTPSYSLVNRNATASLSSSFNSKIHFFFEDDYYTDSISYVIYDEANDTITSGQKLFNYSGTYNVDLQSLGLTLDEIYTLQVLNAIEEKWYLRFKYTND